MSSQRICGRVMLKPGVDAVREDSRFRQAPNSHAGKTTVGLLEWLDPLRRSGQIIVRNARPGTSKHRYPAAFLRIIGSSPFTCKWQAHHLQVIAAHAGQALHVLDRFHIISHLNQAVDQVRRAESTRLRGQSQKAAQRLKHLRWPLLRRGSRARGWARDKLNALLASKLATARAWDLKETFRYFWHYKSPIWAGAFLDYWCFRAMRSRLEPMQKVARMLRPMRNSF